MSNFPVQSLPDGPLDIVGDVHGEHEALERLMARMGYVDGVHPDGRHLVFVGDLVDRGPDSVSVLERVMPWIDAGVAFCILGNHELNLLMGEMKSGNRWWYGIDETWKAHGASGRFNSVLASEDLRRRSMAFFGSLPLVLERSDVRIVHAAWSADAITRLSGLNSAAGLSDFDAEQRVQLKADQKADAAYQRERAAFPSLSSKALSQADVRLLPRHGFWAETGQQRLPHKLITSGSERALRAEQQPFEAGGKWRMATRHRWWTGYDEETVVVMGHYWRLWDQDNPPLGKGSRSDFDNDHRRRWLGPRGNVYCVDFSVGIRFQARSGFGALAQSRLAALRWDDGPARLVTDMDSDEIVIDAPGARAVPHSTAV
jgi:hypothetical protein